jgi:hypothetical protein
MQNPVVFHSESYELPGRASLPFARTSFTCDRADLPRLSGVPRSAEWLYYPRELAAHLDAAGVPYEIHCHSGDAVCGWRMP